MRFSENRVLAWVVLAVCVIGSVVGFGGSGLARERRQLTDLFYDGAETAQVERYSMDAYLDRAQECAQTMAYEAQLRLGADSKDAQNMLDCLEDLGNDEDPDARFEAYQSAQKYSDILYNAVYAADLSDRERVDFKTAYDDFWGQDKFISRDPYRNRAAAFNKKLRGFPAGAVSALLGINELNSFGA